MKKLNFLSISPVGYREISFSYRPRIKPVLFPYQSRIVLVSSSYRSPIVLASGMLKTEDIHPPKTGISVHFSGSLV